VASGALIPVVVGPTAGGKTPLGVEVALEFERRGAGRGEVVTCDAFQVYRGLDIGTAKPTEAEMRGVRHHLIDVVEPTEGYSVRRWLADAERAVEEILGRGGSPVVVGGTHLFVKALVDGLFEGPGADEALREELRAMGPGALRAELERVDPEAAGRIHPNDERRTVRALEVFRLTGEPISAQQTQWDQGEGGRDDVLLVGLRWETAALNARINERVRAMVDEGLVDEARRLWEAGRLGPQAREALGYKQLVEHFESGGDEQGVSLDTAIERIKIETRRFGKNQRTWLRRLGAGGGRSGDGARWIDMESVGLREAAQAVVDQALRG